MADARPTLIRTLCTDLEVRSDGRTIHGVAVPFDAPTPIIEPDGRRYTETFKRGSFQRSLAERGDRIRLFVMHEKRSMPIGRATKLTEEREGLLAEFRVSDTAAGNDALQLVRDGVVDGLSIGFRALRDSWTHDRSCVERLEVALSEVSLVHNPAFDGARVVGIRSIEPSLPIQLARQRLRAMHLR